MYLNPLGFCDKRYQHGERRGLVVILPALKVSENLPSLLPFLSSVRSINPSSSAILWKFSSRLPGAVCTEPARMEGMIKWLAEGMGLVSHPTHFYLHSLRWSEHWRAFSSVLVGPWVGLGMNCPRKSALRSVLLCFCWMEWKLLNLHPPMSCVSTGSYLMCLLLDFLSVKWKHLNFEGTNSSGIPSSRLINRSWPGSSVG